MNEFKQKKFNTDIGIHAKVKRENIKNEESWRAGETLKDIGNFINPQPKDLERVGSAAVHVYQSKELKQIFFITQTSTLEKIVEITADKAMTQLKEDMKVFFGRRRSTLRSGF